MKKESRMGQIIRLGIEESGKNKKKEPVEKKEGTMTVYQNIMKYSAVIGLVGLAYYSIQSNSSLTIPMALSHGLAIYAIFLNKERQ